jgi:hypothetical protein
MEKTLVVKCSIMLPEGKKKKMIVTPGCVNKYPPLKMRLQIVKESLIYISLNICKKL